VEQGASQSSYEQAARNLERLAGVEISPQHVCNLSDRVGRQLVAQREAGAVALARQEKVPQPHAEAPPVAVVMLDGGKVQTRHEPSAPGVQDPHWRTPRYACFQTLSAPTHDPQVDPHPEVPAKFLHQASVQRVSAELSRERAQGPAPGPNSQRPGQEQKPARPKRSRTRRCLVRTAVATLADLLGFTACVAQEAHLRRFAQAKRKACVADGEEANWTVCREVLQPDGFIPILDILHLLAHLYAGAQAAGGAARVRWERYKKWMTAAWSGQREQLVLALQNALARMGPAPPQPPPETSPREVLRRTLNYVLNNLEKMDYPRYRKLGLPISSAPVESLIKQFNRRVKGTEKFWCPSRAEALLAVRALLLSEDGRWQDFWARPRPLNRRAAPRPAVRAA